MSEYNGSVYGPKVIKEFLKFLDNLSIFNIKNQEYIVNSSLKGVCPYENFGLGIPSNGYTLKNITESYVNENVEDKIIDSIQEPSGNASYTGVVSGPKLYQKLFRIFDKLSMIDFKDNEYLSDCVIKNTSIPLKNLGLTRQLEDQINQLISTANSLEPIGLFGISNAQLAASLINSFIPNSYLVLEFDRGGPGLLVRALIENFLR